MIECELKYMKRALVLARRGAGWVNPNPMVGAVLVNDGRVIGEGFHGHYGGDHAEVAALASVKAEDRRLIAGATLYVTLEPCAHHGKTPPCAERIIREGISNVVIAMRDPNPLVNGRGIETLDRGGVTVTEHCLEDEAIQLNEVFIRYITTGLPFVVLKSAMTLDGKIATVTNASRWITCETSRQYVHHMRQELGSVMVGVDTVLFDDPMLNIRLGKNKKQLFTPEGRIMPAWRDPLKIIADSRGRLVPESKVLTINPQLTLVATTNLAKKEILKHFERMGAQVVICPLKANRVDLRYLMEAIGAMGVDSVMIEGGSTLAFSALREGIVDKVVTFIAPKILGGSGAPTPVGGEGIGQMEDALNLQRMTYRKSGNDLIIEGWIDHQKKTQTNN